MKSVFVLFIFTLLLSSSAFAQTQQEIDIYYPGFSDLENTQSSKHRKAADYQKVTEYLKKSGLNYNFHSLPWIRALEKTNKSSRALIVYLDRTPERENDYHWLVKLGSKKDYVFGPAKLPKKFTKPHSLKKSHGVAVCVRGSAQCELFRKIGFKDASSGLFVSSSSTKIAYEIVKSGRGDFFIADKAYYDKSRELMPDNYIPLFQISQTDIYMAAPKSINPALLAQLTAN